MSSDFVPGGRAGRDDGPGLVPALTLVVWVGCLAVGLTSLRSQPPAPPLPPPASQPAVQVVNVMLEAAPTPTPPQPTPAPAAVAAAPQEAPAVPLPSIPTAALPSPAIAFAVPVAGPARIGPAAAAVPADRPPAPVVQRITYGQGVGRQPKPDYPDEARDAGQQGVVTVRMSVDADGRVADAWVVAASPFPLLNRAARDAVRDTWHFDPGTPRVYDVPIRFQLDPAD